MQQAPAQVPQDTMVTRAAWKGHRRAAGGNAVKGQPVTWVAQVWYTPCVTLNLITTRFPR